MPPRESSAELSKIRAYAVQGNDFSSINYLWRITFEAYPMRRVLEIHVF